MLEADLAKAVVMSLPACKGFEVGSGFAGTLMTGREHNDEYFADSAGGVSTPTNRSGGIQGGISNGQPILLLAAFSSTAIILHEQHTVTTEHENTTIRGRGATIRASFRGRCPWWKRWSPWSLPTMR
ncbi:MAG: chorismate synthase [Fimbriimonadales bacterium]